MKKTIKMNETSSSNEVTIGSQVWMAQNLNVDIFQNGDEIPQAKTDDEWERAGEEKQPAWCYYKNDIANGKKYGKLYNWYAVNDSRGLAPKGYHLPTDAEWKKLSNYLGGDAGEILKSISGWNTPDGKSNGNGTNKSGFNGLPGGCRYDTGACEYIGRFGYWWSSTKNGTDAAWYRGLNFNNDDVTRNNDLKFCGFSVRCLKD